MSISFGQTLHLAKQCFFAEELRELTGRLAAITFIRDVYGKIHVFIELKEGETILGKEQAVLQQQLRECLGPYYSGDIWKEGGDKDTHYSLIKAVKEQRIRADWDEGKGDLQWFVLERHISKQAWTSKGAGTPPWPVDLVDKGYKPAVVSFFSFKGGVGRTTGLAAVALTLARNGHRVAMVDLDLEAPGLATIFFPDQDGPGVIDYLIEKPIQGKGWSIRPSILQLSEHLILGDKGETLRLMPAGSVDKDYLEKLGRLDFQNMLDGKLTNFLRDMLDELARSVGNLDFILLDARAGFHDVGGVAVADLSHAAVLFGQHSRQTWAGLTHVIRRLARPMAREALPVLLVHAMAPSLLTVGREAELQRFREVAYDIFREHYFSQSEIVPNENDPDAPFAPVVIPWNDMLRGDVSLFKNDENPRENERVAALAAFMTGGPYLTLTERLCRLFGKKLERGGWNE